MTRPSSMKPQSRRRNHDGVTFVGRHVLDNLDAEEAEYRRLAKLRGSPIPADQPLNNRQQNAVYRNHCRSL